MMNTNNTKGNTHQRIQPISLVFFIIGLALFTIGIIVLNIKSGASGNETTTETSFKVAESVEEYGTTMPETSVIVETTSELETSEPETHLVSLGEFRLTAYCPCEKCCGKWGANRPLDEDGKPIVYTASGKVAKAGYTIAADRSIYPFGTILYINGQPYEVQDVGGAVKGNCIDIYFDNHQDALNFGVRYMEVFIEVDE